MSTTNNHQTPQEEDWIDITNLVRDCASQCLTYSHPFTPSHEDSSPLDGGATVDGFLQTLSLRDTPHTTSNDRTSQHITPVNLRDAMSALELGDKRMDCCEIPLYTKETDSNEFDSTKLYHETVTHPPRIAPKDVCDGTTPMECTNNHLSPCPSLLPYWNTLSLSADSPTAILPLVLLQYTALEAYTGVHSGGSNAAETLFCCMWCQFGVLRDMADRLLGPFDRNEVPTDEVDVAQWVLLASSMGVVRIAEVVRSIVIDADIYEEEDFGVEWEWGELKLCHRTKEDGSTFHVMDDSTKSSFGLDPEGGGRLVNRVWERAISKLETYKESVSDPSKTDPIQAMILLLRAQQSFYTSIQLLYNLNDHNVVDFTKAATKRSKETVELLELLQCSPSLERFANNKLITTDGRVCDVSWMSSSKTNDECYLFLVASFDPFVNRRSLGNTPVRKARFNPIRKVIDSMSNLASELEWSVCDVLLHANTFGRITRMLSNNSLRGRGGAVPAASKTDRVGINVLCRSLMLLNLYFNDKLLGQYDFVDMIGQNMVQLCAVPRSMVESAGWIARLSKPLYDTLKALCLDRHRERAFTERFLFPAFSTLQKEAAAVDEMFREANDLDAASTPAYATNYIIVQTLRLMERHVALGIELGLYPYWYDLSQAFWYRDFLLTALLNVMSTLEKEKMERKILEHQIKMEQEEEEKKHAPQEHTCSLKKAGSGKKKKGKKAKGASPQPSLYTHASAIDAISKISPESFEDRIDFTIISLRRSLCRGTVRLIAALQQAQLFHNPPDTMSIFTTHKRMFEKRFDVFSDLPQPPSLSYDDYKRGSDFSAVNSKDLIASTKECFRAAKSCVDRLLEVILPHDTTVIPVITEQRKNDDLYISIRREEIMALAKVCVSNSLFLLKLETATTNNKSPSEKVALVFSSHKEYFTVAD